MPKPNNPENPKPTEPMERVGNLENRAARAIIYIWPGADKTAASVYGNTHYYNRFEIVTSGDPNLRTCIGDGSGVDIVRYAFSGSSSSGGGGDQG